MWSIILHCKRRPAKIKFLVSLRSSLEGVTSPDGWLCTSIKKTAFFSRAFPKISLG